MQTPIQIRDLADSIAQVPNTEFVDLTSLISVPNTTILNRAQIPNIANDLKVMMGIERNMLQFGTHYLVQNEFGPNGEPVWGLINDDKGLVRFVGSGWNQTSPQYGALFVDPIANDYVEITFYGTGLNLLGVPQGSAKDWRASVDGGAEGSNLVPNAAATSGIIESRNYASNENVPVVAGLTLGIHTVKIRTANTFNLNVFGYEVINESSSLKINPGSYLSKSGRLQLAAQQTIPYNSTFESGALGTRGGRVITYLKPDGTVAKAIQPTNAALATLTSTDHSNEELIRTFHWREFGAGRADDFSTNLSASSRVFTLDDGTTTLLTNSLTSQTSGAIDTISMDSNGSFLVFTFIGTGLDITQVDSAAGGSDTYNVSIDGAATIPLPSAGSTALRNVKICSGLPYGTHTVKITRVTAATWGLRVVAFKIYGPKKPTIPSGAVELADYNIMGNYVRETSAVVHSLSQGIIRKMPTREMGYVDGTGGAPWAYAGVDPVNLEGGFRPASTHLNSNITHTFFGTGYEFRGTSAASESNNVTMFVNGVLVSTTNFTISHNGGAATGTGPAISTFTTGNYAFTPSTGVINMNAATLISSIQVTGLPLGIKTVRFNNNQTGGNLQMRTIDVITPIHSPKSNLYADIQNSLTVGSNSLSDNRKLANANTTANKAWVQALGNAPFNTSSTAFVPVQDLTATIKVDKPGCIKVSYAGSFYNSTAGAQVIMSIFVNGSQFGREKRNLAVTGGAYVHFLADSMKIPVGAGVHRVDIMWKVDAGLANAYIDCRTLLVEEC